MSIASGSRIGAYEVVATIGAGGMGEVYRARDTRLNRDVALKILPEVFASDPERLARFEREAQVLASLNHPHIATIHGIEESNGIRALVLEFVDGETLADRIARGPIPLEEALPIARQIAEALEAAHEQGIIHRDLKPANIKLRPDGTVKVLDFGLAKLAAPVATGPVPSASLSPTITSPALMTGAGVLLGTAAYMSPEQARGREADKRSDVWAFGCLLFEMLTGKRAFEGEDVSDTIASVLKTDPDWDALVTDVPQDIAALLRRCLVKDGRRRIGSMSVVAYALDESQSTRASTVRTRPAIDARLDRRSRSGVLGMALALLAGITISGLVAWLMWPSSTSPSVVRFAIEIPNDIPVSVTGRQIIAISRDGSRIVYASTDRLMARAMSDSTWRPIQGSDLSQPNSPVFSPDGKSIAFFADGSIRRIDEGGGAAVTICPAEAPSGMSWDESGIIFGQVGNIAGRRGIFRCPATGGTAERLVQAAADEQLYGPQVLPGSDALLFTAAKVDDGMARWDRSQIVVYSQRSGQRQMVMAGASDGRYIRTGHLLYAVAGVVMAAPFDASRQRITGGAVPVIEGVRRARAATTGVAYFVTSDNGTLMYLAGPTANALARYQVVIADRFGTVTPLPLRGPYVHVRSSSDGKRLALGSDDGNEAIVSIYELGGTAAVRRLTLDGRNRFPIWSPDGKRVAYQSDRDGDLAIFAQRADGIGTAARLTTAAKGEAHIPQSWAPDGAHLLFAVVRQGEERLWSLALSSREARPFDDVRSIEPIEATFSSDGRWLAYASNPGGSSLPSSNYGVFIQPFPPTGERYQVPKIRRDYHPVWAHADPMLFFVPSATSNQMAAIRLTTTNGVGFATPEVFLARVTADRVSSERRAFDVLPDGRFVGLTVGDSSGTSAVPVAADLRVVLNWVQQLNARVPTH